MLKKCIFLLCLTLFQLHFSESKNVITSFLSYVKSKLSTEKEMVKIIQLGDVFVCLTGSYNTSRTECSCSFIKLKEFEKQCASNLKKNQEEAKECSEEKCEICCKLDNKNESAISILEYELVCQKKCLKSNGIFDLNEDDNKLVFKKLVEFLRIFYPTNTLNYYPPEIKTVEYTNKSIENKYHNISKDLNAQEKENTDERSTTFQSKEMEDAFSPYDEN